MLLAANLTLRRNFTFNLIYHLQLGTSKFCIAPYDKRHNRLVNLSYNCDVKSDLEVPKNENIIAESANS